MSAIPLHRSFAAATVGFLLIGLSAFAQSADRPQAGELTNSVGMKMRPIAPGRFFMGQDGPAADYSVTKHAEKFDDADWDERPAHWVKITTPFAIGATEVTIGQYRQYNPQWSGKGADDEPVTNVSWDDAVKFCEWLSANETKTYRLPTEAEWEYACRAGTTTLFHTGDRLPDGFHKWITDTSVRDRFFPEGKLPPEFQSTGGSLRVAQTSANAWGLFDMHGNVAEWCADWYGPYEAAEQTDPLGHSDGDFRVIRGGSHSEQTRLLRSANRSAWLPETADNKTGFRVVLGELPKGQLLPPAPAPLNAQNVSQALAKIQAPPADVPFFSGPKPFVKIPPKSFGPLFSWHNHSPAITECPNGDLLAIWYSCVDEGGTELSNVASRLRLGSQEWEPASPFWDGADVNDHGPKLWWDGDRTLFHFARGRNENIVRTSTDNGATWSKARVTQPVSEFSNAPIKTREGFIVIMQDTGSTSLNISRDGGQTWTFPVIADRANAHRNGSGFRHIGIHSPVVQLADGRLMTYSRLDDPKQQEKFGFQTPVSFSSDWGATWTYGTAPFPAISSVQRQVLMRLREGPLLFCSYTDQARDWKTRKGLPFKDAAGGEFTGYGLFAALSFDDGQTWPVRRLLTPGGPEHTVNRIDRGQFALSDTMAEPQGYLAATQTRDGLVQLISSKNHYVFNLAWLKALPPPPAAPATSPKSAQTSSSPAPSKASSSPLTPVLQKLVDDNLVLGATAVVANKNGILAVEAVGAASATDKIPMRPDSLFWIASMTKSMTASALMMLVDEGKVAIADPVEKYLPEFKGQMVEGENGTTHPPQHPITIREILSHTSGLVFPNDKRIGRTNSLRDDVPTYATVPLRLEPGTKYEYNNTGIDTAGRIIEVVSGQSYADFMQQRLFTPLGMKDTTFWPNEEQVERLAHSARRNPETKKLEQIKLDTNVTPEAIEKLSKGVKVPPGIVGEMGVGKVSEYANHFAMPAGGLFSTAPDVGQFCQMLLHGGTFEGRRYLSPEALRQMTSIQTGDIPMGPQEAYGLGLSIKKGTDEGPSIGTFGHRGARRTVMWVDPANELVMVLLVERMDMTGEEQKQMYVPFLKAAIAAYGPARRDDSATGQKN